MSLAAIPDPDPRDIFDATILADLPDTAPEITAALREMYAAGYLQALANIQQAIQKEI